MLDSPSISLAGGFSRTFSGTLAGARQIVRQKMWLWTLLTLSALTAVGWAVQHRIERAMKADLATRLETLLEANAAALQMWVRTREQAAETIALDRVVAEAIAQQIELAQQPGSDALALAGSESLAKVRAQLQPLLKLMDFEGFAIVDGTRKIVAASSDEALGQQAFAPWQGMLDAALAGNSTVSRPFRSVMLLPDDAGELAAGRPTMFCGTPLRDASGEIMGALALRFRPEQDFTRMLRLARSGESGETYAFDEAGMLVSDSRFEKQLKQIGLIRDLPGERAIMNIQVRDPGVDMTAGARPKQRRDEMPLTRMATAAIKGESGVDVDGYRDYRGVPVVGAWRWLADDGMGLATEIDVAEAFRPLNLLRKIFWGLFGLLAASAIALLVFLYRNQTLSLSHRRAAQKVKQLGQYQLDEPIGEGGMGVVYRAHHALMRRPTAVKMLRAEHASDGAIARFEREVRLSSRLNHPNTVAIYDYGRTPDGLFYYAMEYLDGVTLAQMIERHGPLPAGRVVNILVQVCNSLAEAHGIGLIHRDIKPANIMLNRRGGEFDVVKVLDFGLVKPIDADVSTDLTVAGSFTGTPLYLAPEVIRTPGDIDPRVDIYAIGAVGYVLLTGKTVFEGRSAMELCAKHLDETPVAPSERLGSSVDEDLERLVLQCLAKSPNDRPQTTTELKALLLACRIKNPWTADDARQWWSKHASGDPRTTILDGIEPTTKEVALDSTTMFED